MNLPNYFLADLPPEAVLTPSMISEACQTLKRNREQYLRGRSTQSMVETLAEIGANWLRPNDPFRQLALSAGPDVTGFPSVVLGKGLDSFFRELTVSNLERLMIQDLGHPKRLDELCATRSEQDFDRAAIANGPEFLVHISAGNIPNPGFTSVLLGLLVRSAQFVKCASGATYLMRLFAHSIYEADHKLGACLEVAEWAGGKGALEETLFSEATAVTATGSDEALAAIRSKVPFHVRFLGYGHRVSFGYIAREALSARDLGGLLARMTEDIVAWNQLGCLSPHVFYVEKGGRFTPEELAGKLAEELQRFESTQPRGPISKSAAAEIASRRAFYEVRAAHTVDTRLFASPGSTAWTVVYESDPRFQPSCLHRFVYVKPVEDLDEALHAADSVRRHISTVGLECPEDRLRDLATSLARWGATRICPIGRMQAPPLTWRHDGRPALGDLLSWTDWEQPPEF